MEDRDENTIKAVVMAVLKKLMNTYWGPLYSYIEENEHLRSTVTGFLLQFDRMAVYVGKTHIAIEYYGKEEIDGPITGKDISMEYHDYTKSHANFLENIIGFNYGKSLLNFPVYSMMENLIIPTDKGHDKLIELSWNFAAQESMMIIGVSNLYVPEGRFARLINAMFFDANKHGLKVRHIKWIDFIPLKYDDTGEEYDSFAIDMSIHPKLVKHDAEYIYPLPNKVDYKFSKLPQINRFIELSSAEHTTELDITGFLEKSANKFILTMAFFGKAIHSQIVCEWQSEVRNSVKPDFFVLQPDGYANIIEFKLPKLKGKSTTGKINRKTFSSEINSYISQTRVYEEYFDDPNNRKWFENKYKFKVHRPKRILVMGRRWHFSSDDWREIISDYRNIEIKTYDDLVDGVVAQFYL